VHHFQVIAGYLSNWHFRPWDTLVCSEPINLWPQWTRNSALSCGAKHVSVSWTI